MKWFEGSIADAVTTSKKRKSIFVVFVEGKDDLSKSMAAAFNHSDISKHLATDAFVSVKLHSGSQSHKQFCEIYKLVPVPSVFFIGQNGSPLEIIAGTETNIVSKLKAAVEKFHSNRTGPETDSLNTSQCSLESETPSASLTSDDVRAMVEPSCDLMAPQASSSDGFALSSEKEIAVTEPSVDETVQNCPTSSAATSFQENAPANPSDVVSIEDKVERAKKLLEIKKEQKKAQEEQNEKEKELERRKTGQAVMEAKRKQQERELQELMEEKKKAKLQEQMAKQRVLEQIAQDRADRAARSAVITPSEPSASSSAVQPQRPAPSAVDANTARIQFKMPNGQSRTHSFPAETTLSQVRQFVDNNIELPFREYQMATTFPRREFTSRDLHLDLRSLQLLPSAVILIMPLQGNMTVSAGPGWSRTIIDMLWDLVQPLITFSRYLQSLVWGSSDRSNQTEPTNGAAPSQTPNPRYSASSSGGRSIRKRGNVHSLTDADNSNDENNTWNGNSTQQM